MGRSRQIEIKYYRRGGKRKGAGRKRTLPGKRRVSHRTRKNFPSRFPLHVTTRIAADVPRLRNFKRCKVIRAALIGVLDAHGFRVCEFSVQGNHLHFVCEAKDRHCLAKGMKRLKHRIACGINRQLGGRKGSVFSDRYHVEVMGSPTRVRNTLCYVLHNAKRHGEQLPTMYGGVDPFSSAWWFDGWKDNGWRQGLSPPHGQTCVSPATTWLLATGWRRVGLISPAEVPAAPNPGK